MKDGWQNSTYVDVKRLPFQRVKSYYQTANRHYMIRGSIPQLTFPFTCKKVKVEDMVSMLPGKLAVALMACLHLPISSPSWLHSCQKQRGEGIQITEHHQIDTDFN